jgi:hypothetical protein
MAISDGVESVVHVAVSWPQRARSRSANLLRIGREASGIHAAHRGVCVGAKFGRETSARTWCTPVGEQRRREIRGISLIASQQRSPR